MATLIARVKGNRIFTIALGIAAVSIWMRIAFRIVEPTGTLKEQTGEISQGADQDFRDSAVFRLSLDYEDPFQVSSAPTTMMVSPGASQVSGKRTGRHPLKAPDILYFGSMINASGQRKALIKQEGKYYYAAVNDTIGSFRVKLLNKDSITLIAGRQMFHVRKRNAD
jgi:hypothetical protein